MTTEDQAADKGPRNIRLVAEDLARMSYAESGKAQGRDGVGLAVIDAIVKTQSVPVILAKLNAYIQASKIAATRAFVGDRFDPAIDKTEPDSDMWLLDADQQRIAAELLGFATPRKTRKTSSAPDPTGDPATRGGAGASLLLPLPLPRWPVWLMDPDRPMVALWECAFLSVNAEPDYRLSQGHDARLEECRRRLDDLLRMADRGQFPAMQRKGSSLADSVIPLRDFARMALALWPDAELPEQLRTLANQAPIAVEVSGGPAAASLPQEVGEGDLEGDNDKATSGRLPWWRLPPYDIPKIAQVCAKAAIREGREPTQMEVARRIHVHINAQEGVRSRMNPRKPPSPETIRTKALVGWFYSES